MLEQELHNQESNNFNNRETPVRTLAPEPDLFRNYEIKNFELSPRLYKIFAASAIFNVMALLIFAQSNLLTRKGCDSPMVSKVCQVLDTIYIGSILMGTDNEFVSKDYEKTELEDAEITYIDVSGQTPPLVYPEGYFALANPEEYAMRQQQMQMMNGDTSGFMMPPTGSIPINPITPNNDLMNVTPTLPPQNNNPIIGNVPSSPLGRNPTFPKFQAKRFPRPKPIKPSKSKNESSKDLTNLEKETAKKEKEEQDKIEAEKKTAQNSNLETSKEEDDGKFNSKPLEDWGKEYGERILKKEIDVNAPFTVEVVAKLDEKGKLIKPQITSKKGSDEKMIEVAKAGIAAFSDTNLLKPLYDLGGRDIVITFSQDSDNLQAIIKTKTISPERANTLQSSLKIIMDSASGFMKKDSDEANLMSRAQVGTEKNFLVINFLISNKEKTELIEKNLKSLEEKLKKNQSNNGVAENTNPDSGK